MGHNTHGVEGRSPCNNNRARDRTGKTEGSIDPVDEDPLQYASKIMLSEHNTDCRYLQEVHLCANGFLLVFFTAFSMHLFLLMTANDGPYMKSCSAAQFDPQHGADMFKMELLAKNVFLKDNPNHVGAYFLFVRTTTQDFQSMLMLLCKGGRFPEFKHIRYFDTDGQNSVRKALEGPYGVPLANIGRDSKHMSRGLGSWMEKKANPKMNTTDIRRVKDGLAEILDMSCDVEEVTQKLSEFVETFTKPLQTHFDRTHKEEVLVSHASRVSLVLCGRVLPDGTVDKSKTQASESAHAAGNRQADAVLSERQQSGQGTSELHVWKDTVRNILYKQSRDFFDARTKQDSQHRLLHAYSHLRAPSDLARQIAHRPKGVSQSILNIIISPRLIIGSSQRNCATRASR